MARVGEIWKKLILACLIIIAIHSTANFLLTKVSNTTTTTTTTLNEREKSVLLKSFNRKVDGTIDVTFNLDVENVKKETGKQITIKQTTEKVQYTPHPPPTIPQVYRGNDICEKNKPTLIIYVHSAPNNIIRRSRLRQTWADNNLFKDKYFQVVFVLGRPSSASVQENIDTENKEYGDIIQGDFKDQYRNLTLKAIFALKWLRDSCPSAKFALKSDDDVFMNVFEIRKLTEEKKYQEDEKFLFCAFYHAKQMPILRNPKTCMKWCVEDYEFPGEVTFPPYCAGLGFLLKTSAVPFLLDNVAKTPFFWIDDVYTTGLLVKNIPNLNIIDMSKKITMNSIEAIKLYKNNDKSLRAPIFILVSSGKQIKTLFKLSYLRLSDEEKKIVNFDVQKYNITTN
ncbi:unnamed protein product [Dimorphilus gyrociliatus]|uniref:Hexosyltransferase n=1 Tax=Dimorphilus gyrociliatus TaxID=2664684 RepID=A0A7I8VPX7_9ANNE|nr:unnamed protein product [Dimorphilus gyrociliatus]